MKTHLPHQAIVNGINAIDKDELGAVGNLDFYRGFVPTVQLEPEHRREVSVVYQRKAEELGVGTPAFIDPIAAWQHGSPNGASTGDDLGAGAGTGAESGAHAPA